MDWILILVGLVTLLVGAEILVRGSVWFALRLGMSHMMVGLTLVAFGTSAPELVVSLEAALDDSAGIATGAVLGSNVANIGLVIGCAALVSPIMVSPRSVRFELVFTVMAAVLGLIPLLFGEVSRGYGILLLVYITGFTALLIARHRRARTAPDVPSEALGGPFAGVINTVLVIVGFFGLIYGGEWLVDGAKGVARNFGMSEVLIGNTIVAIGTSAPELATAIVAAYRGHSEIALGNVLGSNIFNIGMVLGTTATVTPLPVSWAGEGLAAWFGLGLILFLVFATRGSGKVNRIEAAAMFGAYVAFLTIAILRERGG